MIDPHVPKRLVIDATAQAAVFDDVERVVTVAVAQMARWGGDNALEGSVVAAELTSIANRGIGDTAAALAVTVQMLGLLIGYSPGVPERDEIGERIAAARHLFMELRPVILGT